MSSAGAEGAAPAVPSEWAHLERSVRLLMTEVRRCRERCAAAERRRDELELALRDLSGGGVNPVELTERLETVERENMELRDRQKRAAELIRRLRARLDFLEDR